MEGSNHTLQRGDYVIPSAKGLSDPFWRDYLDRDWVNREPLEVLSVQANGAVWVRHKYETDRSFYGGDVVTRVDPFVVEMQKRLEEHGKLD